MKELNILAFVLLFQIQLSAQIEKGQWMVSFSGQYQRENLDGYTPAVGGGISFSAINEMRVTSGQFTPAILYTLKKHWLVGGGIDIQESYTKINPRHQEVSATNGGTVFFLQFSGSTTEHTLSPFLYAEYFYPIGQNLVISTSFSANYGLLKNKSRSGYFSRNPLTGDFGPAQTSEMAYNNSFYAVHLSPTIRYQMFPHFGLQLILGGCSLSQKVDDSRDPNYQRVPPSLGFDLLPKSWVLGIYLNRG